MVIEITVEWKDMLAPYMGAGIFMGKELVGIVKNIAVGKDDAKICMILEPEVDMSKCSMRVESNGFKVVLEKEMS